MLTKTRLENTMAKTSIAVSKFVLPLADSRATLQVAGGKGASLARLASAGLPVPDGFHVTTNAYSHFVAENNLQPGILAALKTADINRPATLEAASKTIQMSIENASMPADIAYAISQAYEELSGINPAVAVRSSATAEDLPELSFAGQQETFLNIQGISALLEAVQKCWASLWTPRAIGYRARHGIDSDGLSLAVTVQLMIAAEVAGILFTANPVTGRHDQVVINAAWGLGEAIVGGQVTPDTITVDKVSGQVLERTTADKVLMTVGLKGSTETRPVPEELRQVAVLDNRQAAELTRLGIKIEDLYNCPVDVEWTLRAGELAIVQARPITSLPEPEAPSPTEWPLPQPKSQFMRTSIIDFMPDPLSPLFGTMGVKALNAGMLRLVGEITNSQADGRFPAEVIKLINDYAYMQVNYTAKEWFWMMTRLVPAFPRMIRTGIVKWRDEVRPHYVETIARWEVQPLNEMTPAEILTGADEVLEAAVDHLGSMMAGTLGASAGSEGLFTAVYTKLVKREDDPWAPAFLMGYESTPIQAEKSLYDLAIACQRHEGLVDLILKTPSSQLVTQLRHDRPPADLDDDVWQAWRRQFQDHLKQFGHIIYDLDIARPLPMDDPTPMLETIKMYLRGHGVNPYERQHSLAEQRELAEETQLSRLRGPRRWLFRKSLGWAQKQAQVREDSIADIGLGYPLLRKMLLELGRRIVQAGIIKQPDDIFWLVEQELKEAAVSLERGRQTEPMFEQVTERKALWRAEKRVTPPPKLPPDTKYLGMSADMWLPAHESSQTGQTIKGLGASPGKVTATACVLHGPEDFEEMQPGEVLVATITTPAWTPLFAMASAVVTDIGGPLSHGSIVAREYGIPAVLGTGVATKRITSGDLITVDGDAGLVILPGGAVS